MTRTGSATIRPAPRTSKTEQDRGAGDQQEPLEGETADTACPAWTKERTREMTPITIRRMLRMLGK